MIDNHSLVSHWKDTSCCSCMVGVGCVVMFQPPPFVVSYAPKHSVALAQDNEYLMARCCLTPFLPLVYILAFIFLVSYICLSKSFTSFTDSYYLRKATRELIKTAVR